MNKETQHNFTDLFITQIQELFLFKKEVSKALILTQFKLLLLISLYKSRTFKSNTVEN